MPRNPGTGVYEQPAPDVITMTPIESTVYNGFVNDVETDLNLPRPIVAGGTGASNAAAARDNLDAEVAGVQVINYDTHVWEIGSFYSLSSANNPPVAGQAFTGIVHGVIDTVTPANTRAHQEARNLTISSGGAAGPVYVRSKLGAAAWTAWAAETTTFDAQYVNVTGDTMSNTLNIISNGSGSKLYAHSPDSNAGITLQGDGGSLFWISAFTPANGNKLVIGNGSTGPTAGVFEIDAAGHVNISNDITVNRTMGGDPTRGSIFFGNTGSKYLYWDATSFGFSGQLGVTGRLDVSQGVYAAGLTSSVAAGGFSLVLRDTTSTWTKNFRVNSSGTLEIVNHANSAVIGTWTDTGVVGVNSLSSGNISSTGAITAAGTVSGNAFSAATNGAYVFPASRGMYDDGSGANILLRANITYVQTAGGGSTLGYWATAGLTVSVGSAFKPGGGAWGDSSDARIKNIVGEYKNGLDAIRTLHPVVYTFKGNDVIAETQGLAKEDTVVPYKSSPHYDAAVENTKFVGLIAQECEREFPEMINLRAGIIDGKPVNDIRGLDSTPLIFALVNAVKTLAARLEALEAAQTTP